jgi:hypothetical protein
MISATCFFGGLSLSFGNFLQRCLRSVAYLNGVPQRAGGGPRQPRVWQRSSFPMVLWCSPKAALASYVTGLRW